MQEGEDKEARLRERDEGLRKLERGENYLRQT